MQKFLFSSHSQPRTLQPCAVWIPPHTQRGYTAEGAPVPVLGDSTPHALFPCRLRGNVKYCADLRLCNFNDNRTSNNRAEKKEKQIPPKIFLRDGLRWGIQDEPTLDKRNSKNPLKLSDFPVSVFNVDIQCLYFLCEPIQHIILLFYLSLQAKSKALQATQPRRHLICQGREAPAGIKVLKHRLSK